MEKKGNLLNQLAIITDLVEKINADTNMRTIIFGVSEIEFNRIYEIVSKNNEKKNKKPTDTFMITIGSVEIIFNKNNV